MEYSLKMEFASENSLEWPDTFSWSNEPVQWVFLNPWYGVDWDLFCVKCQVFSYATSPFLTVIYFVIFIMFIYFLFAYRKIIEVLTYKSRHRQGMKWNHVKCGARWKTRTGLWTGLDWTRLDWTGFFRGVMFFWRGGGLYYFFLVCKKIAFPQQAIFFHLGAGEGKDFTFLLVCVLVLDWSLCLTHGRHISLESWRK